MRMCSFVWQHQQHGDHTMRAGRGRVGPGTPQASRPTPCGSVMLGNALHGAVVPIISRPPVALWGRSLPLWRNAHLQPLCGVECSGAVQCSGSASAWGGWPPASPCATKAFLWCTCAALF